MINHNSTSKKALRKKGRIDFQNWSYDITKMRMVPLIEQRWFIEKSISDYLMSGGRINKLEFDEQSLENFLANTTGQTGSDEFLYEV